MNSLFVKLARMVATFKEVVTDKGKLMGDMVVGAEAQIEAEDGSIITAEDGVYTAEDKVYTVEGGVITAIEDVHAEEPAEEPAEELAEEPETPAEAEEPAAPTIEELQAKINELTAAIEEKDAKIAELEAQLENKPVEQPLDMSATAKSVTAAEKKGALRFFQD